MTDKALKEKLINKIKEINDPAILEEISNLFELQEPESVFKLNDEQIKSVDEAKNNIKNGEILDNEQANKESDEWLKESDHLF